MFNKEEEKEIGLIMSLCKNDVTLSYELQQKENYKGEEK